MKSVFKNFIDRKSLNFRKMRFLLLKENLSNINRPLSILDIGGTFEFWKNFDYLSLGDISITLLNTFAQTNLIQGFNSVVGDARDLSMYKSKIFDLVFSNSVIGHVGNFIDQNKMANECLRVGKRLFLQTPNKYYLIDWRTTIPLFHFLPITYQAWCFTHFKVGTYKRVKNYKTALYLASRIRNLQRKELIALFPGAKIISERFCGFTKSFIVLNGFE